MREFRRELTLLQATNGTTDWFQIGKGVCQGCVLSPCLFNLSAEYTMRNARLDKVQSGIKISGRNINNLRYADDTTFMAESEEELNSLLMKVKEESEKVGLKLSIQKTKIMASCPITSWEIDGETVENSERYGNTRPPDLPLEKSVCRSGSNSWNWTWNNRLVPNRKRSMSRLYIVTLLI